MENKKHEKTTVNRISKISPSLKTAICRTTENIIIVDSCQLCCLTKLDYLDYPEERSRKSLNG